MKFAVMDEPIGSYLTVDAIAALKEMTVNHGPEEVLQTKIVSQQEVRRHLPDWIDPIKTELKALFETKQALRPIGPQRVRQLVSEGKAEILPSKMVWTVKPCPNYRQGRRKARLVACGNFQNHDSEGDSLFAGGATGVALRVAPSMASQFGWGGYVTDVKTAFLNAPMKLGASGVQGHGEPPQPKIAIIKPPPLLVLAGLAQPDEHWEVLMALYGYKESPRLWSDFRDDQLAALKIPCDDQGWLVLDQMITEPNMWRILKYQAGPFEATQAETLVGILLVYVDDLILGADDVVQATIKSIQAKWDTSIPEEIDTASGVRFLGAELFRDGSKWWMTQKNYILDLLTRNLGGDPSSWPTRKIPLLSEPETREDPPERNAETIKEAQKVIGELVWISTRTRPDLSHAINKLASMITKDPKQVIELSRNVWYYLAGTMDHGLLFQNDPDENQLNIYTDASFGEICTGCHLVMWGTSMLLWKSGKQAVVSASTAESELVEILEGALAGDAVRVVLEEALGVTTRAVSFTDNTASISIVTGDSGSWRTRHLKKRAHILKTKVLQGDWLLKHLPGVELPADLGTKVLTFEKFKGHKKLMGMFLGCEGKKGEEENQEKTKENGSHSQIEKTKRALKAIILFAQIAQTRGESDEMLQIWQPTYPIHLFSDPVSGAPFYIIVIVIFSFGLLFGAILMWLAVLPYFHRVTLVQSGTNVIPRPSFLFHEHPGDGRKQSAPRPRRNDLSSSSTAAAGRSDGAVGASSATGFDAAGASSAAGFDAAGASSAAGVDAAGASSAAGRSGGAAGSTSAGASSAAGRSGGAAGSNAAGASSAAGRSGGAAGSNAAGASSAASRLSAADANSGFPNVNPGTRRRQAGSRSLIRPLYTSPMGQRFHCDPECYGLRNARTVHESQRCSICGPSESRPMEALFGVGPGNSLHSRLEHIQNLSRCGEVRKYEPCAICIFSD